MKLDNLTDESLDIWLESARKMIDDKDKFIRILTEHAIKKGEAPLLYRDAEMFYSFSIIAERFAKMG